jgi:hypothetical protein
MTRSEEERDPKFWLAGTLAEVFASHPILTVFIVLGFLGGAVGGAWLGLGWYGTLGFIAGALLGGAAGVLAIVSLYGILMLIGLADG